MATLHDRFHGDGKVFAAGLLGAAEHAGALGFQCMIDYATVRADWSIGPKNAFEERTGRVVALEMTAEKMAF